MGPVAEVFQAISVPIVVGYLHKFQERAGRDLIASASFWREIRWEQDRRIRDNLYSPSLLLVRVVSYRREEFYSSYSAEE